MKHRKHRKWTKAEVRVMRRLYASTHTSVLAKRFRRPVHQVYAKAKKLGLGKSEAFFASAKSGRTRPGSTIGLSGRFPKGHVPANKGLRRPGWSVGRMKETQFKHGQVSKRWDPEIYCIGALRINADGYLDIKLRRGLRSWTQMNRWVWETERGPIPKNTVVRPINGDHHDTRIENLKLMTRREVMMENTLHNYPKPIALAIQLRGALNRKINSLEERRGKNA